MPYRILMFVYRKPGTTPEQFKRHYEEIHIPLIQSLAGSSFPRKHSRRYIDRQEQTTGPDNRHNPEEYPATLLSGTQENFDYDAIVELEFEDLAAFQDFFGVLSQPDVSVKVKDDCDIFMDQSKGPSVVINDVIESFNYSSNR